jgi:DNA-binding CsgD family transcriptional regulator
MAKSAQLRASDVRALYELVGECRDLGDDSISWRRHLAAGQARLIGAGVSIVCAVADVRADQPTDLGTTDWGWENGFDRVGWERSLAEFHRDPSCENIPAFQQYLQRMIGADGVALTRPDLVADRSWYSSWTFQGVNRAIGVDHTLWCFRSAAQAGADEYTGVILTRPLGDANFSDRDKSIAQEAQRLIAPLVGGPLMNFSEPSPAELTPRVRQVLRCLLEGDGDKQIAARLELSTYTVNQYTKLIYRHFNVRSRAELLALWIRRGWGNRFTWADNSC